MTMLIVILAVATMMTRAQAGDGINAKDEYGNTALHYAAIFGTPVDDLLAIDGIDVNVVDRTGRTAVMIAASRGRTETVKLLLARDDIVADMIDKDGNTALVMASKWGHLACVDALIKSGKDIGINRKGSNNRTALSMAAYFHHCDIVEALVKIANVHVNAVVDNHLTALMLAAQNGHTDVVRSLLTRNVIEPDVDDEIGTEMIDVNAVDQRGETALMMAENRDYVRMLRMLTTGNMDPDEGLLHDVFQDEAGRSAEDDLKSGETSGSEIEALEESDKAATKAYHSHGQCVVVADTEEDTRKPDDLPQGAENEKKKKAPVVSKMDEPRMDRKFEGDRTEDETGNEVKELRDREAHEAAIMVSAAKAETEPKWNVENVITLIGMILILPVIAFIIMIVRWRLRCLRHEAELDAFQATAQPLVAHETTNSLTV